MLYIIPTPIGNRKDITLRALEVLGEVDLILCEDTRVSKKLMIHYNIEKPLMSFHAHNEHTLVPKLVQSLKEGKTIALISDAGTPGISDPGFLLSRACNENKISISCLPGATAFVPALVSSGLPCDKFFFEGFLPQKKGRKTRWEYLIKMQTTIVLYESPYRILKCLEEIAIYFSPNTMVCVAREISKLHEEIKTGTAKEILTHYKNKSSIKGEIVVVIDSKREFS